MIFGPVTPGRSSLDRCGPLGRHLPSTVNARPCPPHEAVKRKMQAAPAGPGDHLVDADRLFREYGLPSAEPFPDRVPAPLPS